MVAGHKTDKINLDPGAALSIVHPRMLTGKQQHIGKVYLNTIADTDHQVPVVNLEVEIDGETLILHVAALEARQCIRRRG